MADIKCLEHPTLKVPYEMLNKRFRSSQKQVEKEIQVLNGSAAEIEKSLADGSLSSGQDLDKLIKSMDRFNEQVRGAVDHEMAVADNCQVRNRNLSVDYKCLEKSLFLKGSNRAFAQRL